MSDASGKPVDGVCALSDAYARGALTPPDAVEAFLSKIERCNGAINAFLDLRVEAARAEAAAARGRWRSGKPLSPIDGVPFGVKANIAVKGMRWHAGIGAYRDRIAETDAAVVEKLTAAGAIPLGILNMHEGALGATTDNPFFGRCRNPWDLSKTPGGSSGGSGAAVAAGFCAFALGTDTMGSVRIPSAYCGVAGLKPSRGLVSAAGVVDLSPTLDHVGPHARSAADLAMIFSVLSDAPPRRTDPLRIGVGRWGGAVDVEASVARVFDNALSLLSGSLVGDVDVSGVEFGALRRRGLLVSEVEGHHVHRDMLAQRPEGFSGDFRSMLEWGARAPREKIDAAYAALREAGDMLARLMADIDILVLPTAPQGPFSFDEETPANQADFTALANMAGFPAVAVPASVEGAPPASIQFIARFGRDLDALAAAVAFEEKRGPAPRAPGYC